MAPLTISYSAPFRPLYALPAFVGSLMIFLSQVVPSWGMRWPRKDPRPWWHWLYLSTALLAIGVGMCWPLAHAGLATWSHAVGMVSTGMVLLLLFYGFLWWRLQVTKEPGQKLVVAKTIMLLLGTVAFLFFISNSTAAHMKHQDMLMGALVGQVVGQTCMLQGRLSASSPEVGTSKKGRCPRWVTWDTTGLALWAGGMLVHLAALATLGPPVPPPSMLAHYEHSQT